MTREHADFDPSVPAFRKLVEALAGEFNWTSNWFERDGEAVLVASVEGHDAFERIVWVYDLERRALRVLLAGRDQTPKKRKADILELCARINEGLPFGCAEYSFEQNIVVMRDAADFDWSKKAETVVHGVTSRVLNLAKTYGQAIRAVIDGEKPEQAVASAQEN